MAIASGTRLGPYEIVAPIGEGGMGEVYLARDRKLERDVAIKMLPSHVQADGDAVERFHREARAVAALNHPNIVTIYGVDEADGRTFLAMELVDGRTLKDIIPAGGLPLEQVLQYAIPLADALAAAHAQGIAHRDLKPANVMISSEGRLKVLDFGLAKLRDDSTELGATVTQGQDLTAEGQVVGTVSYMSPEQASGGDVDTRTDLFSLGILLYEMSTGQRPFTGATSVEVLAAILKDKPPPVSELRASLPRDFSRIVRRALAKDREQRYQTAKDFRNDLQTLREDLTSGELASAQVAPAPRSSSTARTLGLTAVALAMVILVASIGYLTWGRPADLAPSTTAEIDIKRLTTTGDASLAAISPDGKYVVHVVSGAEHSLRVRQTATTSDVEIVAPGPERYGGLAIGPNGDYVYFTRRVSRVNSRVFRVPILGGTPQAVLYNVDSAVTFSPDGSLVAFIVGVPSSDEIRLMLQSPDGSGEPTTVAVTPFVAGEFAAWAPLAWSPDGTSIAVATGGLQVLGRFEPAGVALVDVATGDQRAVPGAAWGDVSGLGWLDDETLIVSGTPPSKPNHQLWRVGLDGSVGRITNDLNSYLGVATSRDAGTVVTVQGDFSSTLSVTRDGDMDALTPVTSGMGRYDGQLGLAWTHGGELVYSASEGGQFDLWKSSGDGANPRRLTSSEDVESAPVVAPDDSFVVFRSAAGGGLARIGLAGGTPRTLTTDAGDTAMAILGDESAILFQRGPELRRLDGDQDTVLVDIVAHSGAISPDGRHLAAITNQVRRGTWLLGLIPTDGTPPTVGFDVVSFPFMAAWTLPDGDALTFLESRQGPQSLWNQPIAGGPPELLLDMGGDRVFAFAWSDDGRLAIAHGPAPTDVVLITGVR